MLDVLNEIIIMVKNVKTFSEYSSDLTAKIVSWNLNKYIGTSLCTFHPVEIIPYLCEIMLNKLKSDLCRSSAHNHNILGGMSLIPDALFGSNELRALYTSISVNSTEFIVWDRSGESSTNGKLNLSI